MIGGTIGRCVVVLALFAGCYEPQFVEGLYCSDKGDCPPGQECMAGNRCYLAAGTDARLQTVDAPQVFFDANEGGVCNPLTQAGCQSNYKCTWITDQLTPYVGHIGCAPAGGASADAACVYNGLGYDNCAKGLVCGDTRGATSTCKVICDVQGGSPTCDSQHACSLYSSLFETSGSTTPIAGVCDTVCDPLADNDFDGAGSLSSKSGSLCGGSAAVGCYGYPSFGTAPVTAFTCTNDVNSAVAQPLGLRHRVQCATSNNCADSAGGIHVNGCNQGYIPLLEEQTGSTQVICVSMCKPAPCYSGNCGASNTNRNGDPASLHQCTTAHRLGSFASTEHCQYLWWREIDNPSSTYLPSAMADTVGFCMDFAKYRYDSNSDGQVNGSDLFLPTCDQLGSASVTGGNPLQPTTFFGATDLGCVPSSYRALPATGKSGVSPTQKRALIDLPRTLYRRTMQ